MEILLLGCGKMGGAMLKQWRQNPANRFTIADPAAPDPGAGVSLVRGPDELGEARFDAIIVAVKPQMIADVLPDYTFALKPGGCVISIAAGTSVASLEKILGHVPIIRVMPNLPAMVGHGVSGLYANDRCSAEQRDAITALIDETGVCVPVDSEDRIDRLTAISGSGPGYVFEIIRSYIAAAEELGFTHDEAKTLVLGTIGGAVETARQSDEDAETLRNSVTSKNGTTEAGLNQLRADGVLDDLLRRTVNAAYARAQELR